MRSALSPYKMLPLSRRGTISQQTRSNLSTTKKRPSNPQNVTSQQEGNCLSTNKKLSFNNKEDAFRKTRSILLKAEKRHLGRRKAIFRRAKGRCLIYEILSEKSLFDRFVYLFSVCLLLVSSTYPFQNALSQELKRICCHVF